MRCQVGVPALVGFGPKEPAKAGTPTPGFTLIEMLICILLMTMMIAILMTMIVALVRLDDGDAAFMSQVVGWNTLADQFRTDVAVADETLEKWEDFRADKSCLILKQAPGKVVVYKFDQGELKRRQFGKEPAMQSLARSGDDELAVEFSMPGPRLCVLKIASIKSAVRGMPDIITAALGGDRR